VTLAGSSRPAPRIFDHVATWVFDLDNTLYPHHVNLWQQVDERIRDYIANFLKIGQDEAFRLQKELLQALRHLDARADDRAWHAAGRLPRFRA
jgi:FMN phosphatase YigB (HAD superfamily)